jgi:hypothetical protein
MAKVVYVVFKERPHIGHITWLRAMRALGHEVKLASLQRPRMPINHGDILITEGVRPTAFSIGCFSGAGRLWRTPHQY